MRANPLRSSAPRPRFSFLQTALLPAPTANPGRAVRFTSHFVRKIRWFRTASPGCWTVRSFYSCRSFVPVPSLPKKSRRDLSVHEKPLLQDFKFGPFTLWQLSS